MFKIHVYFVHRYATKQPGVTKQPRVRGKIAPTPRALSLEFPASALQQETKTIKTENCRNDDDEDFEVKVRPDVPKLKSLRKTKVPTVVIKNEPPEESSFDDEKPIRYFVFLSSIQ